MNRLRISTRIELPHSLIIEIDGKRWGSLPKGLLPPLYQSEGEYSVEPEQAEELLRLLFESIRDRLFSWLAKAEHSQEQSRIYLKKRLIHPQLIEELITLAKEKQFLSEERFTELYLRSLLESGKSRRYIIQKLKLQKIQASLYEPLFEEYYNPEESQRILQQEIGLLLHRFAGLSRLKAKEKVFSSLYRKGWSLEEIRSAWNAVIQIPSDSRTSGS